MAEDIRCPMCSKTNPADSETCRYCGARMSPLGKSPAAGPSSSETPDWLRDIRTSTESNSSVLPWHNGVSPDAEENASAVPDWLAEVRGSAQLNPPEPPVIQPPEPTDASTKLTGGAEDLSSGMDDWLSSLRDPTETTQPAGEPAPQSQDDWAVHLQNWTTPGDAAPLPPPVVDAVPQADAAAPAPAGADAEMDLAAWLKNLEGEETPRVFSDESSQPESEFKWPDESARDTRSQETGVTDWLSGVAYEPPALPESAPGDEADLHAWLNNPDLIREEPPEPIITPPAQEAIPDWLTGEAARPEPPAAVPAQDEAMPDWLSDFASEETGAPAAPSMDAVAGPVPEWLNQTASAVEDSSGVSLPAADPGLPDWLAGFEDTSPAAAESAQPAEHPGMPSWVSADLAESQPPAADADIPATKAVEEIPDFATLFAEEPLEPKAPAAQLEPAAVEDTQPFKVAQAAAPEEPPVVPIEEPPSAPDWLAAFGAASTDEGAEPAAGNTGQLPFIDPQKPSWLDHIEPEPAAPADVPASPALFEEQPQSQPELEGGMPFKVDLPDWLGDAPSTEADGRADEFDETETLAPAELPGWVQEMRPLESVIPGQEVALSAEQQRVEKAGPLAGMRGVLPAEELASNFRKLPTYSAKLRVSERQRSHASLLQNVLDVEAQPFAIPVESSQAPQYIYRLLIAVVLILAMLAGLLLKDFSLFPPPQPSASDQGLLSLYNAVQALPAGSPVLLAVDYEPALSGEMRYAATAVIEHLMARNAHIVMVSTVPAGPVLASDLLASVQHGQPNFDLVASSVNLGYLAGGSTSLLEFAQRPSVAAPLDFSGAPAWNRSVLGGVQTIRDFHLVIVLTDNVETGRSWVEQVQPMLGGVPLTMVASAQAGPLLQPYLDAGQIHGLVTGLVGGAMYEQRTGKLNLANKDWNSYQFGYTAGILMLILGGIISAVMSVVSKQRKGKA